MLHNLRLGFQDYLLYFRIFFASVQTKKKPDSLKRGSPAIVLTVTIGAGFGGGRDIQAPALLTNR
jgi:hypothetical protein